MSILLMLIFNRELLCHLSQSPEIKWESLHEEKQTKLLLVYRCEDRQSKMLDETETIHLNRKGTLKCIEWTTKECRLCLQHLFIRFDLCN